MVSEIDLRIECCERCDGLRESVLESEDFLVLDFVRDLVRSSAWEPFSRAQRLALLYEGLVGVSSI